MMDRRVMKILRDLEELAERRLFFNIPREAGEYLNLLIKINKPRTILEVGTSNGYSTMWLAEPFPETEVITIEIKKDKVKMAGKNFDSSGLHNIKIIHGDALQELPKINSYFDFVFLDAIKKDYLAYLNMIKLNKGAIIVADNILTHSEQLKDYINYVRTHYKSELIDIGNGMEI